MKKAVTTVALGTLLVTGFLFSQGPAETASELEPTILSISNATSFF